MSLNKMEQKPLISILLLAYKQERFVRDAIEGVLSQTYSPLEIIISDDCSPDNTFQVMQDAVKDYNGPHKIILNHNETNMGIAAHYDKLWKMSHGEIVIAAAGDDKSLPNRAQRTYEIFQQFPKAVCVNFESCSCDVQLRPLNPNYGKEFFTEHITNIDLQDYIEFEDFGIWSGDTRAIRRCVNDVFGYMDCSKDEDSSTFFRSIILGEICHSREIVSLRRIYGGNVSNVKNIKKRTAEHFVAQPLKDIQYAVDKGILSPYWASRLCYKVKCLNRAMADAYYEQTSLWYRLFYAKPIDWLRRLKNKVYC